MKVSKNLYCLSILALALMVSCSSKNDDPVPSTSTNYQNSSGHYFKGQIGDSSFTFKQNVGGLFDGFMGLNTGSIYNSSNDIIDYYFAEGTVWTKLKNIYSETKMTMIYTEYFSDVDYYFPTMDDFSSIWANGNYTQFSVENTSSNYNSDGWSVAFIDASGETWNSNYPGGDQTGSYVNITSGKNEFLTGDNYFVVKGTISCNVYNSAGTAKTFTGSFYQIVSAYQRY